MKYEVKHILRIGITLEIICSIVFVVVMAKQKINVAIGTSVYTAINIIILVAVYTIIARRINRVFMLTNEIIQSLINGNPIHKFPLAEDTLLSKLQSQLIKLNDILVSHREKEKRYRIKISEMISDISHQIKTPFANLKLYSSFLSEDKLSFDEQKKFIYNIQLQTDKLSWLVESLMKMSRLEAGIINLNPKNQPLIYCILKAIDEVELKAKERNIDIALKGDQNICLRYDLKWTSEVIFNILENAIKYSPEKSRIEITIIQYEMFSKVDIKDEGKGIHESEITKVFQRFYRGQNTEEIEGAGIGLYLARKIIMEQGGYIKVTSILGEGSSFAVFLPNIVSESCVRNEQ